MHCGCGLGALWARCAVCTSSGTNGSTITLVGAGTYTVTASQAGNADYDPAPSVQQSFTVNRALVSITANNQSMRCGKPLPALTWSSAGRGSGTRGRGVKPRRA